MHNHHPGTDTRTRNEKLCAEHHRHWVILIDDPLFVSPDTYLRRLTTQSKFWYANWTCRKNDYNRFYLQHIVSLSFQMCGIKFEVEIYKEQLISIILLLIRGTNCAPCKFSFVLHFTFFINSTVSSSAFTKKTDLEASCGGKRQPLLDYMNLLHELPSPRCWPLGHPPLRKLVKNLDANE